MRSSATASSRILRDAPYIDDNTRGSPEPLFLCEEPALHHTGSMRRLPVAREAWLLIIPLLFLTLAALLIQWYVAALVLGFFVFAIAHWLRDPHRTGSGAVGDVLAPADGVVTAIHRQQTFEPLPALTTHVTIMSSLFDVQVNRAPIGGRVARVDRIAPSPTPVSAEERNEQSLIVISDHGTDVAVRQFGGLLARVIVDKREGEQIARGERIGMITFGSRVDLLLPEEAEVTVEPGQRVTVGLTAVARVEKRV